MERPVLVTGASGKLGAYVVTHLQSRGRAVVAWSGSTSGNLAGVPLQPVDLANASRVREAFSEAAPTSVIHCGAVSTISEVHADFQKGLAVNRDGTAMLGELCSRVVYVSTDLVFDGREAPYSEDANPTPLSLYGRSKHEGEQALKGHPGASVVRISLLYGPALIGSGGFYDQQLRKLRAGETMKLFHDEWRTPLALDEAAAALVELLDGPHRGVLHLGGPERLSRFEMGQQTAAALGVNPDLVQPSSQSSVDFPEPRPRDVSLDSSSSLQWISKPPSTFSAGLKRLL